MNNTAEKNIFYKILMVAGGLVIGFIISKMFFSTYRVNDNSMNPGFTKNERVLILKTSAPGPGDVVLIKSPVQQHRVSLKRIIAVEGDTVEIINKAIYINNKKMDFKWKVKSTDQRLFPMEFTYRDTMPAIKIGRNHFFLLGDNHDRSFDSRAYGPVSEEAIIGKVIKKF